MSASIEQIWNIVASRPKFVFSPTFIFCGPICPNKCGVVFFVKIYFSFREKIFFARPLKFANFHPEYYPGLLSVTWKPAASALETLSQQQPTVHSGDRLSRPASNKPSWRGRASGRWRGLAGDRGSSLPPFHQPPQMTLPAQNASGSAAPALGFTATAGGAAWRDFTS